MTEGDESLRRLFQARSAGDSAYLIESLRQEPEHAVLAAEWLTQDRVEAAIPALVRLLDAADPMARVAAIKSLGEFGLSRDLKPRLAEIATTDEDDAVRSWATSVIGNYRDRALTPLLVSLLEDPSWRVSSSAALALGRQGDVAALAPLRRSRRALRRSPTRFWLYRRVYADAETTLENLEAER